MRLLSRRRFIAWLLASGASVWVDAACAPSKPRPVAPSPSPTETAASVPGLSGAAIFEPPPVRLTAPPEPGRVTPTDRFYVVKYSDTVPVLDLSEWRLTVTGLVERTLTLTWDDVMTHQQIEAMRTLECISNPAGGGLIGNATWQGVSLRDLLLEAGIKQGAKFVTFDARDDYFTTVPLERAMDERALLVHRMNGGPLPREHGFPLRVLLVGVYGQKQPKWISNVYVSDQNEKGPWEKKGWSNVATVRVNSRIEMPENGAQLKRGQRTLVAGMAFSGLSGIQRVEIGTDTGRTWDDATLIPGPSPYEKTVWTGWYSWWTPAETGRHLILARATDGDGNSQGEESGILAGVHNGISAMHQIQVTVVA